MNLERSFARSVAWLRARRLPLFGLIAGVLIPLCLFGVLADEVLENATLGLDRKVLLVIHSYATPPLDAAMLFFSRTGSAVVLVPFDLLVLAWLARQQRWSATSFWALAIGGAALLNLLVKLSFGRIRPDLWLSLAPEMTFSFPSGHAMHSMAVISALVVLVWSTRWRWPAVIIGLTFVLLVGLSRAYLGVHYATDIVAAWMLSLAWVAGLTLAYSGRLKAPALRS